MKVKHTFYKTVVKSEGQYGSKREPFIEYLDVPEGSRFYHVRAPLMVRQFIGNKEATPAVVPNLAHSNGGCTILISPHDDDYVQVRVAWARFTDAYNRSLGRFTAASKDPTLVKREELEAELEEIERQMLLSCAYPLRRDAELLEECLGDWSRAAARYYQPEAKNAQG
jgi:hypothetical protein